MNIKDRQTAIATELAKKELNLSDKDLKDQDKLKALLVKQDEISEDVNMFVIKTMATIAKAYPGVDVTDFEVDIIMALEKKVEAGEITSVETLYSPDTQRFINDFVINSGDYYNFAEHTTAEEIATEVAVGITLAEFINKDMTQEEIRGIANQYRNSTEFKENMVKDIDYIFNGQDGEEKQRAAANIRLREISDYATKINERYGDANISKAYAISAIVRDALNNDGKASKDMIYMAKEVGFISLIKTDGNVDFDIAYEAMLETAKEDPKVRERYATKEKFIEYFKRKNERAARVKAKELDEDIDLQSKYKDAQTTEEKVKVLESQEQKRIDRKEIMDGLKEAIHTKNTAELQNRMVQLAENNPEWAKVILLKFASGENTAKPIQAEIISFVNDRYSSKDEKEIAETPEVQGPKKPDLDDGER